MKAKIAELWATALESGKYKQGDGQLTRRTMVDGDPVDYDCCLGVLTKLAIEAGVEVHVSAPDSNGRIRYNDRGDFLSIPVMDWAGLKDERGIFAEKDGTVETLAERNDTGSSFAEIAALIRTYQERL